MRSKLAKRLKRFKNFAIRPGYRIAFFVVLTLAVSCKNETLPKPKAMLRLEYPAPVYDTLHTACPFYFQKNTVAKLKKIANNKQCWFNLEYPKLKATLYLSYYPVSKNLDSLFRDAQNITQEHVIKADEIVQEPYVNEEKKVYGMLYKVSGDAASQSQFYITDSIDHFISGSVYFRARPNYDSLLPAAHYLHNDVVRLIETLDWQK